MNIASDYTDSIAALNPSLTQPVSSPRSPARQGGDTVDISDEARQLFSKMLHNDTTDADSNAADVLGTVATPHPTTATHTASGSMTTGSSADSAGSHNGGHDIGSGTNTTTATGGAGGVGGTDTNTTDARIEKLEAQIAQLSSQLTSLPPGDAKAEAINNQIAALQAQLTALKNQNASAQSA